jgi:autotransporter-associated beta strand protein
VKTQKIKIDGSLSLLIEKRIKMLAVGLSVAAGIFAARADSLTWDPLLNSGGGGTGTWNLNTTANWWNGTTDVKWPDNSTFGTNTAVFGGTAGTVTLNTSLSASNLQFTAPGYTLSGTGTLTLGSGGIDSQLGSGTTTVGVPLVVTAQQPWLAGGGSILAINGAVTRNTGGAIDFSASGVTHAAFANDATGIIGGWATVGGANSSAGDWAANDGTGQMVTYNGYTAVASTANSSPDLTGSATQNWESGDPTGAANFISTITNTATLNSLIMMGDVQLANGTNITTLTLNSGGLILRGPSRWLLAGTNSYLTTGNPTGELFVHAPSPTSGLNWTLWPIIKDNGATPLILVKDGVDQVKLGNMSTYTGGTLVNAGILAATSGAEFGNGNAPLGLITPFGSGPISIRNGAQLQLGANAGNAFGEYDYTNAIFADGGLIYCWDAFHHLQGPLNVGSNGVALGATFDNKGDALNNGFAKGLFVDGPLTGSGPLAAQDSSLQTVNPWNSSVVYFTSMDPVQNTYNGTVTVNAWNILGGSYLYLIGTNVLANATVNVNGDNDATSGRFGSPALLFGSGTSADGLGYATIGALTGNGSFALQNTKIVQSGSSLGAGVTLTIGNNNANSTYSGSMSGSGGIVKIGNGTLTLSGAQAYTGDTVLSGGSIVLAGGWLNSSNIIVGTGRTLNFSAISPVNLVADQTLWGNGTFSGSVNANSTSGVSAGTDGTYGTNAITGSLTMASGAVAYFDVSATATGANDLVTVGGTLTANNNVIHLKAPDTSVNLDSTADYVLFSSPNNISGTFATSPTWDVAPANAAHFSIVTGTKTVTLHYSAVAGPTGVGSATPSPAVRNQNVLIKVIAANGTAGTVNSVTVDTSSVGGSATLALVNNGANVWTNTITIPTDTVPGSKLLVATVSDTAALSAFVNIPLTIIVGNDVWNGLGADNNFSTGLNWTNQTAPALVGDSLQFAGSTRLTPNVDNNYIVTGILFGPGAGAFNIGSVANSLSLTNGTGVVNNSANTQTLSTPISVIGAASFNAATGNLNLAGPITTSDNTLVGITGPTNTLLTGSVNGNGSLFKQGSGSLTISSSTTWAGGQASSGGFSGPLIAQSGLLTFNNGSTHNVTGELVIGGVVTNGGVGNNSTIVVDNSTLNISSWLSVGRGNGTGTVSSVLILTNNAVVSAQNMSAGYNGGSSSNAPKGSVILSDTSALTVTGGTMYVGESSRSDMIMNVNGTATVSAPTATLTVGANSGKGALNINGGSVSVGSLRLGSGANLNSTAHGVATVNSGTLSSEGDINLGFAGTETGGELGQLVVNGGTVNLATTTLRWFIMGQWDTAASDVEMNGGILNINANSAMRFAISGNNGTNVFNLNGGAVTFYADNATTTAGGTGVIDMHQGNGNAVHNSFNLNGGTLTVSGILSANTNGTRAFNFNGGTLKPVADNVSFMDLGAGNTAANIRNGGAIIDTAGFNVTVPQMLQHSVIAGDNGVDGGVTKLGAGTLILSGTNSYNGNTVVNAGKLEIVQPSLAIGSTVNVANGAVLQLDFTTTNRVSGLVLNGVSQAQGVYSATTSPTFIAGTGSLLVGPPIASNPTNITVGVNSGNLTFSWPADHLGWFLQRDTNSLSAPVWIDIAGSDASTTNSVPINPAIPTSFFRLRHP